MSAAFAEHEWCRRCGGENVAWAATYPTVTAENFPHGLRCGTCSRAINPGQPYSEQPDGFIGDTPSLILTCVYCIGPRAS